MDLLRLTPAGLYCEAGEFYIDPWQPVENALITHAHSDHARWGMGRYLCAAPGLEVLRTRMGDEARIDTLEYGETITRNGVKLSLHPAGHILGSSQVRVEDGGQVWVVSGDYKVEPDPTCRAFELVKCNVFITESTFGLPIYRWPAEGEIFGQINAWWKANQVAGRTSMIFSYTLGKAQRVLAGVDPENGPIFAHGAVRRINEGYRWAGVKLPEIGSPIAQPKGYDWSRALIVAPPSANGTPWMRRFGDVSTGFASGWMQIRGARRRRAIDRGFVLSDHADWPGLLSTVKETGAERVLVTHGYSNILARYLAEQGLQTGVVPTRFVGEGVEADDAELETPVEKEQHEADL
ncbi:MAG TPA: ligase-associated DNA damage response exonuclease [Fimbriimonadaceae bacterium]|jgi:putative mRNA 3-end processing factor